MFPNLLAEMARKGITGKEVSQQCGFNYKTWQNKLNGKTEFTRAEMIAIRNKVFKNLTLDYLFISKSEQKSA